MKNILLLGSVSAVATGMAIGLQSLLSGKAATISGTLKTGLWINFLGGVIAGLLIILLTILIGKEIREIPKQTLIIASIAGSLGIMIISGISLSISLTGVTAGLAATMLGQFAFGLVADTLGWSGDPIPLDFRRIAGIAIMTIATILLLPKD